jgi:hypothetical protein
VASLRDEADELVEVAEGGSEYFWSRMGAVRLRDAQRDN